uniref:Uncharacterized protein n=1 Tax=Arundo donax TaxID=35708 RepID=A0A0A9B567_ARUDO
MYYQPMFNLNLNLTMCSMLCWKY